MKRFIRYFLVGFSIVFITLIALLHWSGFQKACLLGVLRCNYKDVRLENFQGGATVISWDRILCNGKQDSLTISRFELKWHPWRLIFGRTLSIDVLRGDVAYNSDNCSLNVPRSVQAGWFSSSDGAKTYSILKNLQSPLKLDIASTALNLTFNINGIQLKDGRLKLQNLHPGQAGIFYYDGKIMLPQKVYVVTHGEFLLQANSKGAWEKIRCSGEIRTSYKGIRYPRLSFNGMVDGTMSTTKEEIRAELHCGQANDFLLTGECVKDSERVYDFKWQGFFDHSMLKFLNTSARPTLSILTEGNCVFNRKRHIWTTHTNLSAWGKHFESIHPSLKSLPCLSFKAQLDADIGTKQLDLKQYKFVLKEKGASRLFLDVTSLHPLTYIYKGNKLGLPSKEDSQIFEINFYETPFEIFNPYLRQYGFQLAGNLQSGNVNIGWNANKKRWTIATFQPICAQIRQLKKEDAVCIKDVTLRLNGKSALNQNFEEINYDTNWVASDSKHVSFFKFSPKGYVNLKDKTILGEGAFSLDNSWAKELLALEPLGVKLDSNLSAKLNYNFEYKKENLLINQLKLSLGSSADRTIAMELKTEQPLTFSGACWKKTQEGNIASFVTQNYPLDFVQYAPYALSGMCNGQVLLKKVGEKLQCASEIPLNIANFRWQANSEDRLSLRQILLDFNGACDENLHWSANLAKANIVSDDEMQPLFAGNCEAQGIKTKVESTQGQIVFNLDKLCAQPMMLRYPGFVGEFHSHWIFNEKQAEANGRLRCQLLGSNIAIEAKSSYKQAEKPLMKTSLELQSKAHSSDIYADTTWDKNGAVDCLIHSEHLFVGDLIQCYDGWKQLSDNFIDQKMAKNDGLKSSENIKEKQSASVAKIEKVEKKSKKEFPFQGLIHLNFKSINTDVPFFKDLNGTIAVKKDAVRIEDLQGALCEGKVALKADYSLKNDHCEISANGVEVDVNRLSKAPGDIGCPLDKYGQFGGKLAIKLNLSGELGKPFSWHGSCDMICKDGYYKLFNSSNKAGQALGGIASTLGLLLSANVSGMGAVGFLTSYIQNIPFNEITASCSRNSADDVVYKGEVINDDLAIALDGRVGMKPELECAQQPLVCTLKFSAPSDSPFTNYFPFDLTQKDKRGYGLGPNCKIGGTLGKPDYKSLIDLVTSARKEAPEPDQEKVSPVKQLLKTLF